MSRDYALTRVGREPAREMIMARLAKEPLFASNNDAALNMFTCRYGHDSDPLLDLNLIHSLLVIAMKPCSPFSSTCRRNMVVQKNIYGAMWASQTMKSQLSRAISLSLDHDIYSLETWISHNLPAVHGSCWLFGSVRESCKFQYH